MIYQLMDRIKVVVLEGQGILLDPNGQTYYYINDAGNQIMGTLAEAKTMEGGVSFQTLKEILLALFDVSDDDAAGGLQEFLDQAASANLVEETQTEASLPAPPRYPWDRREYEAPVLEETPDEIPEPAQEHWSTKVILPPKMLGLTDK